MQLWKDWTTPTWMSFTSLSVLWRTEYGALHGQTAPWVWFPASHWNLLLWHVSVIPTVGRCELWDLKSSRSYGLQETLKKPTNPQKAKKIMWHEARGAQTRDYLIPELEAKGSGVEGHPQLLSIFEVSLDYVQPCLKKQTQQNPVNSSLFHFWEAQD